MARRFDDIAAGAPSAALTSGGVAVVYGGAAGLSLTGSQYFTQNSPSVPGANEPGDNFGFSVRLSDFNGDGRADLAVGVPFEDIGADAATGSVVVLPSSGSGLTGVGSKSWTQDTAGVPGASEDNDNFGYSLAAGDINEDGIADLAIGSGGEAIGSRAAAGSVTVLKGTTLGLTASGSKAFNQDTSGVPGTAEAGDFFGDGLALGDFNGDGADDLAVGAPGEAIGSLAGSGSVTMIYSSGSSLTGTGSKSITQGTAGVPGADETGDLLGYRVGSMTAPTGTAAKLVIGLPGEDVSPVTGCGSILVLNGGPGGVTGTGSIAFNPIGLTGGTSSNSAFGAAFA